MAFIPAAVPASGTAATFEEAKENFERAWLAFAESRTEAGTFEEWCEQGE